MSQGVSVIYKEPNTEKKYITFFQVPSPISDSDPVDEYFCKRICELHEWDYVGAKKEPISTREFTRYENDFAVAITEPSGIDEACRHIRNFVEHKELPDEELI